MKHTDVETKINDVADVPSVTPKKVESTTEFPVVGQGDALIVEVPKKEKKRGLFSRNHVKEDMDSAAGGDESEIVLVMGDKPSSDTLEDTCELSTDFPTQVMPEMETTRVLNMADTAEILPEDDKEEQILLEGFEEKKPELTDEEKFRLARREKIQDFSQKREQHLEAAAENEKEVKDETEKASRGEVVYPETPLETVTTEEKTELEKDTAENVIAALTADSRKTGVQLFLSAVLAFVLMFMEISASLSPAMGMRGTSFLVVHLILVVALVVVNLPMVLKSLRGLFAGKPTVYTGATIAALVTLTHTALQFLNVTGVEEGTVYLLSCVVGFSFFMLALSQFIECNRRVKYAQFVLSENAEKTIYKRIEDPVLAEEIGRPAVAMGVPQVAYYRSTQTVEGYTETSDDRDLCVRQMKWYLPLALGVSFIIAVVHSAVYGLSDWMTTVGMFTSMVAISCPAVMLFALQLALHSATRYSEKEGAVITGYQAVDDLGSVHALALDAMDIFPENCVLLHGIKTFSGTRIDDAILDAASVSVRAGGPLSHVFRRMIQNKVDMLRDVDTLVYEQDMGLSGWVNGRRVLIGNRKLLDNHGIDIPSKDYEQRYAKNGRQLVYLSIAGELSAMFVVSYIADPATKEKLIKLTKNRVTLLIRTCDQNITEELIATVFDLNGFYVELLNAPSGRAFEGLVDGVSESERSTVVSTGHRSGLIFALALITRLKKGMTAFTVLQTFLVLLGIFFLGAVGLFMQSLFLPLYLLVSSFALTLLYSVCSLFFARK